MNPYTIAGHTLRTSRRARRDSRPNVAVVLTTFVLVVLFVLFVLSTACSATQDAVAPKEPAMQLPMANTQAIAAFIPCLSDAQSRLLPALSDAPSVSRLATALTQIEATLSRGDQKAAEDQIALARAIIAAYPAAARINDAVELSVIEIVIDRAAQILGLPALPSRIGV